MWLLKIRLWGHSCPRILVIPPALAPLPLDFYSCQAWNVSGAWQTSANSGCRSQGSGRCNSDPAFIWKVGRCLCSSGGSSFHSFNDRASWDTSNPSVAGLRLSTGTHSMLRELLCCPQKPGTVWFMMGRANMRQNGPILCLLLWYLVTTWNSFGLEGVCRTQLEIHLLLPAEWTFHVLASQSAPAFLWNCCGWGSIP